MLPLLELHFGLRILKKSNFFVHRSASFCLQSLQATSNLHVRDLEICKHWNSSTDVNFYDKNVHRRHYFFKKGIQLFLHHVTCYTVICLSTDVNLKAHSRVWDNFLHEKCSLFHLKSSFLSQDT